MGEAYFLAGAVVGALVTVAIEAVWHVWRTKAEERARWRAWHERTGWYDRADEGEAWERGGRR